MHVALCPHISVEHFRGGEKWTVEVANRLVDDGDLDVSIRALPYTPGGERRVSIDDVLDDRVSYTESWRHDLSDVDTAYIFYNPLSKVFFDGEVSSIAGIHSWVFVSKRLFESHYGIVPTAVKALYRTIGRWDLSQFDAVHSVTPAFKSPHPNTAYIPNFVDTTRFSPSRASLAEQFTVFTAAAHIPEKGWDTALDVAALLPNQIRFVTTGETSNPHVDSLGFLTEDELAEAYARAHVVLHPSRVDTDSMVINEATASGTPVITTPLSSHVRNNEAILHCTSASEMARTIRQLYLEWKHDDGYDVRSAIARKEGKRHGIDVVYPRLKRLLCNPGDWV